MLNWENVKKILCCASLVTDLVTIAAFIANEKAKSVLESDEAKAFIKAADDFAALLKTV